MESLTELYRIGRGPSSSYTIGPERACRYLSQMIFKTGCWTMRIDICRFRVMEVIFWDRKVIAMFSLK